MAKKKKRGHIQGPSPIANPSTSALSSVGVIRSITFRGERSGLQGIQIKRVRRTSQLRHRYSSGDSYTKWARNTSSTALHRVKANKDWPTPYSCPTIDRKSKRAKTRGRASVRWHQQFHQFFLVDDIPSNPKDRALVERKDINRVQWYLSSSSDDSFEWIFAAGGVAAPILKWAYEVGESHLWILLIMLC